MARIVRIMMRRRPASCAALVDPPCHRQTISPGIAQAPHCFPVRFDVARHCTRQSPIDIRDGISVDLDPVVFDYRATPFRVLDNGHTVPIPLGNMPKHLPRRPSPSEGADVIADSQLPSFLQVNQKITYKKDGVYHKGYLGKNGGMYRFVYKRHPNSKHEEWGRISRKIGRAHV
mgnify:CR=1 FL=1